MYLLILFNIISTLGTIALYMLVLEIWVLVVLCSNM